MAWRFPKVLPISGDMLHPSHWNDNIDVYGGEVNGFIDRDNLSDGCVQKSMIVNNAFVDVFTSEYSDDALVTREPGNDFDINMNTTAWQTEDIGSDRDKMPSVTVDVETDGWVICDFHASYEWLSPKDPNGGSQAFFPYDHTSDVFGYRSGAPVLHEDLPHGRDTPSPVVKDYEEDIWEPWQPFATDPLWRPAGPVSSAPGSTSPSPAPSDSYVASGDGIFVKANEINTGLTQGPVDRESIAFRILVDGITVAETGWMSIGMYKNGAYLTGVAPVSAGIHTITTQVRVARIQKMNATSGGGLADSGGGVPVSVISFSEPRVPGEDAKGRVRSRSLNVVLRKR